MHTHLSTRSMAEKEAVAEGLGLLIRRARQKEGLSQAALAERIGVTQGAIAAWEQGRTKPTKVNRRKIEHILGPLSVNKARSRRRVVEGDTLDPSSFGTWLREQRGRTGFSARELARRAQVSSLTIYNIEGGRIQNPQAATRDRLAAALGATVPDQVVSETIKSQDVEGLGSLTDFQPHNKKDWPACAGVYVLYDNVERPMYVGKAENISLRLRTHEEKFWYKRPIVEFASYIEVKDKVLRHQLEQVLIKFLKSAAVINRQGVDGFA